MSTLSVPLNKNWKKLSTLFVKAVRFQKAEVMRKALIFLAEKKPFRMF